MMPLLLATMLLLAAAEGKATPVVIRELPAAQAAPPDAMVVARQFTARRTRADCVAEAAASSDIVVCAPLRDQDLPVPEVYGPVPGSTDGAAVDPHGVPCGASISNNCYSGIDLIGTAIGAVRIVGLIFDPDQNLGEGAAIPKRFRGANR
jgi:hypothetical protein